MLDADQVKRINLIEVLLEECEEQHGQGQCQPPPEDAFTWSEDRIRSFFSSVNKANGQFARPESHSHSVGNASFQQQGSETRSDICTGSAGDAVLTTTTTTAAAAAAINVPGSTAPGAKAPITAVPSTFHPSGAAHNSGRQDLEPSPSRGTVAASLLAPPSAPTPELFNRWFPGLVRSGTSVPSPRLRVICFPSAGNAEDMYTSEGTGARRAASPLLSWCKANGAEVLAVQPPGRGSHITEQPCDSAQHMARELMRVLGSRLCDGTPYALLSHSMGCWVAFELLLLARSRGMPMCRLWLLSAMPAPDLEFRQRPWRQQRSLAQDEFQVECRGWDINETVFMPGLWEVYEPLLRADFRIFDEYTSSYQPPLLGPPTPPLLQRNQQQHTQQQQQQQQQQLDFSTTEREVCKASGDFARMTVEGKWECPAAASEPATAVFGFPIVSFWGKHDRRVTEQMVRAWGRFSTGSFDCREIDGNHLWPLSSVPKMVWLQQVVKELGALL
ncbi:MAG: hypothetical protein WDW36_001289 [Sanguina aurantia]